MQVARINTTVIIARLKMHVTRINTTSDRYPFDYAGCSDKHYSDHCPFENAGGLDKHFNWSLSVWLCRLLG